MKKISICLTVLIGLACNKPELISGNSKNTIEGNKLTIAEAKIWYAKISSQETILSRRGKQTSVKPVWESARQIEDSEYYVLECSIASGSLPGFSLKKNEGNLSSVIGEVTKLLVKKNKITGAIHSILLNIYSSTGYNYREMGYKKIPKDFKGVFIFSSTNFDFINGWQYEEGVIIGKLSLSKRNVANREPIDESLCTEYYIDQYERDCYWYSNSADNYCSEWMYTGTIAVAYCSVGGGGSGDQVLPNEVESQLQKFKDDYEVNSAALPYTIALMGGGSIERVMKYDWICGKAVLLEVHSIEEGVHKYDGSVWKWKNLTHKDVYKKGVVIGGSVNIESHSGISQVGIYNALMNVTVSFGYNAIIPNFSPIYWNRTISPTKIFNVSDAPRVFD